MTPLLEIATRAMEKLMQMRKAARTKLPPSSQQVINITGGSNETTITGAPTDAPNQRRPI